MKTQDAPHTKDDSQPCHSCGAKWELDNEGPFMQHKFDCEYIAFQDNEADEKITSEHQMTKSPWENEWDRDFGDPTNEKGTNK